MKRTYANRSLQVFYDACRKLGNDPSSEFYYRGRQHRGAGHRVAYWNGRNGLPNLRFSRGTFAYVAFMAGRDDRAEFGPGPD